MTRLFLFSLLLAATSLQAQPRTDTLLDGIFRSNTDPLFREVVANPEKYRLQVIYTRIDRDRNNKPSFKHYYYHYDPSLYFNPASMVKLPLAILALEKLDSLAHKKVNRNTTILFDSSKAWQTPLHRDTTAANGLPSIAHLIKRALLISENDPYNRLYQFVGQGEANRRLHQMGYDDVRITRQFLGLTAEQNRWTNAVRFVDDKGATLYRQPEVYNRDSFHFSQKILLGKAYMNRNDSLVQDPFDFTAHNNLSLGTMQQVLQSVLFPSSVPANKRFRLSSGSYRFIHQYLSQFPSETPDPKYDTAKFYDSYVKFFFRDSTRRLPKDVRVFNKVGWSYGFLTDVSYVVDHRNKIEYMLAATLYVNEDEVLNDGKYEYNTKGYPFLYRLGQTIYQHELRRPRSYKPKLEAFRLRYEHRDPNDKRRELSEVDN